MNISKDLLEVLKVSFDLPMAQDEQVLSKKKQKLIKMAENKLDKLFDNLLTSTNVLVDESICLSTAYLNMSSVYINCTDEEKLYISEDFLMRAIELLDGLEIEREAILTAIKAYNRLGYIWYQIQAHEKSKPFFEKAVELYVNYKNNINGFFDPVDITNIIGLDPAKNEQLHTKLLLEKLHLMTLQGLTKMYLHTEKEKHKFAKYLHMTLTKQLSWANTFTEKGYIEWAISSASLSHYFIKNNRLSEARHHLAAASYMLQRYEKEKLMAVETQEYPPLYNLLQDDYKRGYADIARYWARYGIALLRLSRNRSKKFEEDDKSCKASTSDSSIATLLEESVTFVFTDIKEFVEPIASQITDQYLSNFPEVKKVFVKVLKWLDEAKTYFTLYKDVAQHAQIVQEISQAYRFFSHYEEYADRQIKLHKRRIEVLTKVNKSLNLSNDIEICKQFSIELAVVYATILDIKMEYMRTIDIDPNDEALGEITQLVKSSMYNYQTYLECFSSG